MLIYSRINSSTNAFLTYRNPTPDARPSFKDILTSLIRDEEQLLTIPFEDASTHAEACHLGENLMAGCKMYSTLQTVYLQ